ncbi:hypothetical protein [Nonomuraea sp. NPDC049400]|uniref:hypothetical protein n=1 Tax=Nonomuraea sp. NPDC049400 TaxID=3364352 RepID=UPI00379A2B29
MPAGVGSGMVDALGDESSRYLAMDAEDRALDVLARAEALAIHWGDHWPAPPVAEFPTGG